MGEITDHTIREGILILMFSEQHLFTQGLLGGRHSDIKVTAFGQTYALHRLILDRSPFFSAAFNEP